MPRPSPRPLWSILPAAACLLTGCVSVPFNASRYDFYHGKLAEAEARLADVSPAPKDRVLLLMERGTIRQANGEYEASSRDFIAAQEIVKQFETYSVSKGVTSLVVNDSVLNFAGAPYERTLLHSMTALDHLAMGHWDNGAVEARRIIETTDPQVAAGFPQDAFSMYLAGFCLELIDDPSNAALMYRKASELMPWITVNENSGWIYPTNAPPPNPPSPDQHELVCFIMLDHGPRVTVADAPSLPSSISASHADIYAGDDYLGRSVALADTHYLAARTDERLAAIRALKTSSRIVIKEAIASTVEVKADNDVLGDLIRLVLIGLLEHPDVRRWETLPRWFQVARVPCPPELDEYRIVVQAASGRKSFTVRNPIRKRGRLYISFFRDRPAADHGQQTTD